MGLISFGNKAAWLLWKTRQRGSIPKPSAFCHTSARDLCTHPLCPAIDSSHYGWHRLDWHPIPKNVGLLLAARHLSRTPRVLQHAFNSTGSHIKPYQLIQLLWPRRSIPIFMIKNIIVSVRTWDFTNWARCLINNSSPFASPEATSGTDEEDTGPRWLFLPVYEYMNIPGVENVARVGHYDTTATVSGRSQKGEFIGVDRLDFARVSFWRKDFASPAWAHL